MTSRIVDASPLLFLSRLGRLPLLRLGADHVLIPGEVLDEIRQKSDPALAAVEQGHVAGWLEECFHSDPIVTSALAVLGRGERAVSAQAASIQTPYVVLDDLEGRRRARAFGLRPIGTVGLLLAARKQNVLPSLQAELQRLKDHGFWISQTLWDQVLQEAGEV